jgi:hypothetical protein
MRAVVQYSRSAASSDAAVVCVRRASTAGASPAGQPPRPAPREPGAAAKAQASSPAATPTPRSTSTSPHASTSTSTARPAAPPPSTPTPLTARVLGYGGLLPFAASAVATIIPDLQPLGMHAASMYSCSILSFVGAVHWGVALSESAARGAGPASAAPRAMPRTSTVDLVYGVVPSILAAGAGVLPARDALAVLMPSHVAAYAYDRLRFRASNASVPPWYMPLRRQLTASAVVCMLFAYLSTSSRPPLLTDSPAVARGEGEGEDAVGVEGDAEDRGSPLER